MEEEKKDMRRSFVGPNDEEYFLSAPNAEDIRGADWQYSKTYTKCLVEGITTRAEMLDILTRRGIIGTEFEKRVKELARNLREKLEQLDTATSLDDKRDLAIEISVAREELYQWNQRLDGPMNNTCENMSDDARLEYLTSCMIQRKDGSRVWNSYDAFLTDRTNGLPSRARFEVMLFLQGLESNFLDQTPEAVAMREVETEILAKADAALKTAEALEKESETLETVEVELDDDKEIKKAGRKPRK
jgi:hypothetical protein